MEEENVAYWAMQQSQRTRAHPEIYHELCRPEKRLGQQKKGILGEQTSLLTQEKQGTAASHVVVLPTNQQNDAKEKIYILQRWI